MINQIFLICFVIISYEFIKYIKFHKLFLLNFEIYKKIFNLLKLKRVSDLRKEKLILNYSKLLFVSSIKILCVIIIILFFIFIINLISETFFNLVISVIGIIELTMIFIFYHIIRIAINGKIH